MPFVWDTDNITHIARHGVTPGEAEEVATGADAIVVPARGRRLSAYGTTATGRPVRVIYDLMSHGRVRVITAYPIRRNVLDRIRQEAET